jgi:hypothetical protein
MTSLTDRRCEHCRAKLGFRLRASLCQACAERIVTDLEGKPVAFSNGCAPLLPNRPATQWFRSVSEAAVRGDHLWAGEFYRWETLGDGAADLDTWPLVWLYRVRCPSGLYEVAAVEPEEPTERGKPEIRREHFEFGGGTRSAVIGSELEIARDLVGGLLRRKTGPKHKRMLPLDAWQVAVTIAYADWMKNYDEPPTDSQLAAMIGISPRTFSRRKEEHLAAGGRWPPARTLRRR